MRIGARAGAMCVCPRMSAILIQPLRLQMSRKVQSPADIRALTLFWLPSPDVMQFFLPAADIDVHETRIWDDVRSGDKDAEQAYLALASAR
eukprot:15148-Eustigmatos_ZCMA.PRE.1